MPETIRERILAHVKTTLQGITVAGGYATTVRHVSRSTVAPSELVQFPTILIPEPSEDSEEAPLTLQTQLMHLRLIAWIHDDRSAPETDANRLLGDMEQALLVDHTRGGLAVDTTVTGREVAVSEEGQPHQRVVLSVDVHYRHRYGQPTVVP